MEFNEIHFVSIPVTGADMWSYQACTEMVMPFCYDGANDMFEKADWDLAAFTAQCQVQRLQAY